MLLKRLDHTLGWPQGKMLSKSGTSLIKQSLIKYRTAT
jgi:hypothetical protein